MCVLKIETEKEKLGFCYTYKSLYLNEKELHKLFNFMWSHMNNQLLNEFGEHGNEVFVVFHTEEHKKIFEKFILGKPKSFAYKLSLLLMEETVFVG